MKRSFLMILNLMLVLLMILSPINAFAGNDAGDISKYKNEIYTKHEFYFSEQFGMDIWQYDGEFPYEELYYYYGDSSDTSSADEATPDFVLVHCAPGIMMDAVPGVDVGPFVVHNVYTESMGTFGYHIYVPKSDELYSLEKAYEMGIEGVDKAILSQCDTVFMSVIGDADKNTLLDIRDATAIQKVKAGLLLYHGTDREEETMDFNRDRKVDIKDATAIQKYIAGLEYM